MFSICRKLYFPHWQLLQSHNWLCTLVSYITHHTLLQHVSPQIQGQDTELCRSCNGRCCRTFSRGWTLARSSSGTAATATLSRRGDTSRWLQNLLFYLSLAGFIYDDVLTPNLPNTAPAGWLLHPRELGGAPRGGGAAGGRVLAGGGGHHPDLHLLQQGRRHAGGLRAHGRWPEEGGGGDCAVQCLEINTASCSIARAAADKWGTIVAGGIVQTASYRWIDV